MMKEYMNEAEVLAMVSHSQEFEQIKVSHFHGYIFLTFNMLSLFQFRVNVVLCCV